MNKGSQYYVDMTKNPVVNAIGALGYILLVVSLMTYMSKHLPGKDPAFFAPLAFLSLFTLSAAVMGSLFIMQPLLLYLDGKKKAGVELFLKTVGVFAVFTLIAFIVVVVRLSY